MIYITGDTHGDRKELECRLSRLPGQPGQGDILIVTGDFGFVFRGGPEEDEELDALAQKPFTLAFVDGNHENFPLLETFPEEIRWGAPVKRIRENIFWLRRGNIYHMEGASFFVMGGAYSLDKNLRLYYEACGGAPIWFAEELPRAEEYHRAGDSLKEADYRVDYILTHTAPAKGIWRLTGNRPDPHEQELAGFLDWVYHEVSYRRWFFGHFHEDRILTGDLVACMDAVHPVSVTGEQSAL